MMDENLSQTQKMLIGFIKGFEISNHICYASNRYIASILSLSSRQVSRKINDLVKNGYIQSHNNGGSKRYLTTNSITDVVVDDTDVDTDDSWT